MGGGCLGGSPPKNGSLGESSLSLGDRMGSRWFPFFHFQQNQQGVWGAASKKDRLSQGGSFRHVRKFSFPLCPRLQSGTHSVVFIGLDLNQGVPRWFGFDLDWWLGFRVFEGPPKKLINSPGTKRNSNTLL